MKKATILALAAMLMVPAAGSLHAQGRGEAKGNDSYQGDRKDDRKDDRAEKPGRRVGPSPHGPGRRVGPNGARRGHRGSWGDYVMAHRGDLDLSDRQVSDIKTVRERYETHDPRYSRTTSGGAKDPAYGTVDGQRKRTDAELDEYRKVDEWRAKERREIEAVLTPAQREKLRQRAGDAKSGSH